MKRATLFFAQLLTLAAGFSTSKVPVIAPLTLALIGLGGLLAWAFRGPGLGTLSRTPGLTVLSGLSTC